MKLKITTLTALAAISAFSVSAQQSIGIQAGAGIGRVRSDIFQNSGGVHLRLNFGATYERLVSRHLTVGADLLYQQRGFRDQVTLIDIDGQPTGTAKVPFNYNYIALPLKVGIRSSGSSFGYVRAGLVPALLLNTFVKLPDPRTEGTQKYDLTDDYRRFDLAGLLEAGGGFPVADHLAFTGGLAFQYSLTSASEGFGLRNYGLSLNFGLRYELKARKVAATPGTEG